MFCMCNKQKSNVCYYTVSGEIKEYFGQFGQVKKCLLPFVSIMSSNALRYNVYLVKRL